MVAAGLFGMGRVTCSPLLPSVLQQANEGVWDVLETEGVPKSNCTKNRLAITDITDAMAPVLLSTYVHI